MPWEVLQNVATVLTMKLGFSPPLDHFTMKIILEILSHRWHYRQLHLDDKATLSKTSLIDLMSMSRIAGYRCTDPRDYVFGMLGMTDDEIAKGITVDYEKSTVRTLFMHVARLLLEAYGFEVFSHCFLEPQAGLTPTVDDQYPKDEAAEVLMSPSSKLAPGVEPSRPDLSVTSFRIPSWVPTWSNSRSQLESKALIQNPDGKPFGGASMGLVDVKPLLQFGSHDTLLLKGILLDQVARTYAMPYERPTLNDWFQKLALMIQDSSVFLSEEQKRDALWRTPCANVISEAVRLGRTATEADGRFIDVLLTHKATKTAEIKFGKDNTAVVGRVTGTEHLKSRLRLAWSFPKPEMFEELEVCMRDYAFSIFSLDWKIYITQKGYLGLGPISTETGDWICVFPTAEKPHILRNVDTRGRHLLVGETYVHGLMNGELRSSAMQTITLV